MPKKDFNIQIQTMQNGSGRVRVYNDEAEILFPAKTPEGAEDLANRILDVLAMAGANIDIRGTH